jgi:hypothetical protein
MRWLARLILTILAAFSLLLCVAVCALWIDTYWVARDVVWHGTSVAPNYIRVESEQTQLRIAWVFRDPHPVLSHWTYETWPPRQSAPPNDWRLDSSDDVIFRVLGASLLIRHGADFPFRGVLMPYWMMVLGLALLPAFRIAGLWRSRRSRARRRRGLCQKCGYDLRASSERCPECGTPGAVVS